MDFEEKLLAAKIYALERRMEDFFAMKAIPCNPQQLRHPQPQVPQFQPQQHQERKYTTEDVLAKFMINTEARFENINNQLTQHGGQFNEISTMLRNLQASIQSLENQVGQLARANCEHSLGNPLSNIENNPSENLMAVNLGCGQQVEDGIKLDNEDVIMGMEKCEEVEEAQSTTIEETTCLNIDHSINPPILVKCTKKIPGIVFEDVGKELRSSLNPPMPGLDNSQPKIFPWRPKQILWALKVRHTMVEKKIVDRMLKPLIDPPMQSLTSSQPNLFPWKPKQLFWRTQGNFSRVEEENVGRRLRPSNDPPMPSLNNSRPNLFPWRPKQLCVGILKGICVGTKEEAGRRFKPSKDPPKFKLHNSRPKLFPWRPKGNSCLAFNLTPSRKVCFVFLGSSYATSSRDEHTIFKPP